MYLNFHNQHGNITAEVFGCRGHRPGHTTYLRERRAGTDACVTRQLQPGRDGYERVIQIQQCLQTEGRGTRGCGLGLAARKIVSLNII